MKKAIVFMFSGQGSQYYNMGKAFYDTIPTFKMHMNQLDSIYYDITGKSVLKELYSDGRKASESFDQLIYTHPAIFMTEYAFAQVLLEKGIEPDYILGSSLGEFVAGALAGVLDVEDMLENVVTQAQIFEKSSCTGGMMAVVDKHSVYFDNPIIYRNSELAAINFDSHFVVSGGVEALAEIEGFLRDQAKVYLRLPVKYPFHSSLIDCNEADYTSYLGTKRYNMPEIKMISCMTGGKVQEIDYSYYWKVIRKGMDFPSALRCIEKEADCIYIDLGPSGTLANFTKYNLSRERHKDIYTIITPLGDNLINLDKLYNNIF